MKMKLSYRIGYPCWQPDEGFEQLLSVIQKWKNAVDEIALFIDYSHHGYYPLEEYEALVPLLKSRMQAIRDAGIPGVGINILCSIGHLDEGFDWLTRPPFQTMVGHDGSTSISCMCMRAPEYMPYLKAKYTILAQAKPDFIWVDDDIRMRHHGVEFPCFCHNCVETFNRRTKNAFTRESLVKALDSDRNGDLRREFLQYNNEALQNIMTAIREAVHAVDPGIKLGLMTGGVPGNSYSLADQEGYLKALGAEMIRPGGGFYTDEQPMLLIDKAVNTSVQNAYAQEIPDNQYELEDFPDPTRKSVHMHLMEFATAFMAGCNGIAVDNVIVPSMPYELMDAFANTRSMWDQMVDAMKGMHMRGYYPALILDCEAAPNITHSIFSNGAMEAYGREISLTGAGIAWTALQKDAEVCVISGDMMAAVPKEEIPELFSRGVLMDTDALKHLIARGYGDLAGCVPGKGYHSGLVERYEQHPVNGQAAGILRNVYMNFWDRSGITIHELEPMEGAEVMSSFETITGVKCGAASTAYENRLGGRVAVLGYFPWTFLEVPGKRDSLPALMDWLAKGRFPVMVEGSQHVVPMLRTPEDKNGFVLWLINASFDKTPALKVRIDASCTLLSAYDVYGKQIEIPAEAISAEDGFTYITPPAIDAWNALLLIGK